MYSDAYVLSHRANLDEANAILRRMAGRGPIKSVLWEIQQQLSGFSLNRLNDIWKHDERVRVHDEEVLSLRIALAERLKHEEAEARRERLEILDRIASMEAALMAADPDMASPQIDAFRRSVGFNSRSDSTLDRG